MVTTTSWDAFRVAVGLVKIPNAGNIKKLQQAATAMVALGIVAQTGANRVARAASAVGLSALTALLACSEGIGNLVKGKIEKRKGQREDEPWPKTGVRENQPTSESRVRDHEPLAPGFAATVRDEVT